MKGYSTVSGQSSHFMPGYLGVLLALVFLALAFPSQSRSDGSSENQEIIVAQSDATQNANGNNSAADKKKKSRNKSSKIKSFDVTGISLGMGLGEVEENLRQKYPDYSVLPINYQGYGQKWTGILAAMPNTKHKTEVILVDFTQPPLKDKAIAISRYKEYPADATPSLENLEKSLRQKYGKWTSAETTQRAGYRKIYSWHRGKDSCIGENLYTSFGRMKKIVDGDSLSRVLGDAYGDPSQYVTGFRDYVDLNQQTAACGRQITVEVNYRPDQQFEPVNKLIVVVANFKAYVRSEVAFSKLATQYNQKKATEAVNKGGEPEL